MTRDDDQLDRAFAALADPVRVRLVSLIGGAASGEICACDLPALLDRSQPTISHHLTLLGAAAQRGLPLTAGELIGVPEAA